MRVVMRTWRGYEVGHEFGSDLPESVRVLGHVAQQVDSQPREARLLHASRTVPAKIALNCRQKGEKRNKLCRLESKLAKPKRFERILTKIKDFLHVHKVCTECVQCSLPFWPI